MIGFTSSVATICSSCPALCRASTSFFANKKQGVDGRDEPGHDVESVSIITEAGIPG